MLQSAALPRSMLVRPVTQQDEQREKVREWLDKLQRKYRVSPRAVATRSGVAPSTIYRWLDEDAPFVMSLSKLTQVANAFDEPLPEGLGGTQAGRASSGEGDLEPLKGDEETDGVRPSRWIVTSEALSLEGFRPGDIIDFDMGTEPTTGDVVIAQIFDLRRGVPETVLRLFQPPFLLTRSMDQRIDPKPEYVDNERVVVLGRFARMRRERRD